MNILIVDDFKPIVETIANGIDWNGLGINRVFQANSAKEAKLLLANFEIDIMLCDIEMPEESGLELFSWVKEHNKGVECIFLTSHAEFDYALEAMKLGSFDYILQPAKFEEIEAAIRKLIDRISEKKQYHIYKAVTEVAADNRDDMLDLVRLKMTQEQTDEAEMIFKNHLRLYVPLYGNRECSVRQIVIKIEKWKHVLQKMSKNETQRVLKRTISSMLDEKKAKVAVTALSDHLFWVVLFLDPDYLSNSLWKQQIQELKDFICNNMDMTVSVFSMLQVTENDYINSIKKLITSSESNDNNEGEVCVAEEELISRSPELHPSIAQAITYIKKNLNKNISRTDVAQAVNLNDEYFSRLFKKETGETYKDYTTALKMNMAKKMLDETTLSIGIIASKVGYANFSHFSQAFKEFSGYTPAEYKKRKQV